MKRKVNSVETFEEEEKSIKMLKLNQSCNVQDREISNATSAIDDTRGRKFDFQLTDKKAKANILVAAKRRLFEIETKQKSKNMKFSAGAVEHTS